MTVGNPQSSDELVREMPRDAFIVCAGLPGAPTGLLAAICRNLPELGRPTLYCADLSGAYAFLDEIPAGYENRLRVLVGGGPIPRSDKALIDVCPFSTFETDRLITSGRWHVDVALVRGLALGNGDLCLSPVVGSLPSAAAAASVVLAEVDETLPLLKGATRLQADRITGSIASVDTCFWPAVEEPNEVQLKIAAGVAELVPDGASIQVGIGSLAEAVLSALAGHSDLGVHSGFIGDGVAALVRSGAITGAHHPVHPGRIVTGALLGTPDLFAFADDNDSIVMAPFGETSDPVLIARVPDFVAVNSATSVDLLGQVGAEGIAGRMVAAGGGQMDYMPAAHQSQTGAAIIALPSTTGNGRHSRIAAPALLGGPVTSHRNWVDFVVTEHGTADLRGAGLRDRMQRLIDIAHPEFRDRLGAASAELLS